MSTYGLLDANNFYVSVERVFDPAIQGTPLVVLSNGDGCAIARSNEAKGMGVGMGLPRHMLNRQPGFENVHWLSSNYALYADMSRRIYQVLERWSPGIEPYSIDEFFLDLDRLPGELRTRCWGIKEDVLKITKIPTCLGVGPTKTLAKLANRVAKDDPSLGGLCDLSDEAQREDLFDQVKVDKVWGIGDGMTKRLNDAGASTIADFLNLSPTRVRDMMTVVGARIQAELMGHPCLPLQLAPKPRKSASVFRSFSMPLRTFEAVREAVSFYAVKAAEKVRGEGMMTTHITVFLHTSPHHKDYHSSERKIAIEATNDTHVILGVAGALLASMWTPGLEFVRAGVALSDLVAGKPPLISKLLPAPPTEQAERVLAATDAINARFGPNTIQALATGTERPWMRRGRNMSPHYTTRLEDIMVAKAI